MKAGEMGERAFLKQIEYMVSRLQGSRLAFDEDASDIPIADDNHLIVNVDTFVQSTDWLPEMTPAQVGRKTAVMTISDLLAKGVMPMATMMSLCIPHDFESEDASEIIRGFSQYCLKNSIPYIGGDMGSAEEVVITGIALGTTHPDHIVTRSGAKTGDIIATTGMFGLTSVAFEILLNHLDADDNLRKRALQAAYKPELVFDFVSALARNGAITASMDSSDGLGVTLHTMAAQSKLCFVIEDLPSAGGVVQFSRNNHIDEIKMVMGGGEEFILVLTIPENQWNNALEIAQKKKVWLKRIGYTKDGEGVMYESSEGYIAVPPYGYDNFREWA